MAYQAIFKRYEIKYMITREQKQLLLQEMEPYMALDRYGRTAIRNIYFDTPDYRLIRRSIERPAYKEKLRLRSYSQLLDGEAAFVELKKKYNSVVYKRRLTMPEQDCMQWLAGDAACPNSQIGREMEYFRQFYRELRPMVFLSYQREAYYCRSGGELRITFDDDILCREAELSLTQELWGKPILDADRVLMEVKTNGGMPIWLAQALSRHKIYKTSFSKYGKAYENLIFPTLKGGHQYVR